MTLSVITHLHYVINSVQILDLELFIITNYLWFGNLVKLMDNLCFQILLLSNSLNAKLSLGQTRPQIHVKCYFVVVGFCRIGPFQVGKLYIRILHVELDGKMFMCDCRFRCVHFSIQDLITLGSIYFNNWQTHKS